MVRARSVLAGLPVQWPVVLAAPTKLPRELRLDFFRLYGYSIPPSAERCLTERTPAETIELPGAYYVSREEAKEGACIAGEWNLPVRNQTMPWTQAGAAAVVVAQQFNPSVVTQLWLRDNRVLAAEDFQDGSIFSDYVVQVRSRLFTCSCCRTSYSSCPPSRRNSSNSSSLRGSAPSLSCCRTPRTALGLNFSWHLTPVGGGIGAATRPVLP